MPHLRRLSQYAATASLLPQGPACHASRYDWDTTRAPPENDRISAVNGPLCQVVRLVGVEKSIEMVAYLHVRYRNTVGK